jgi:hypothetical protein
LVPSGDVSTRSELVNTKNVAEGVDKLTPGSGFIQSPKSGSAGSGGGVKRAERWMRARHSCALDLLFLYQKISHEQGIHAGTEKRTHGVGGRIHDWLTAKIE